MIEGILHRQPPDSPAGCFGGLFGTPTAVSANLPKIWWAACRSTPPENREAWFWVCSLSGLRAAKGILAVRSLWFKPVVEAPILPSFTDGTLNVGNAFLGLRTLGDGIAFTGVFGLARFYGRHAIVRLHGFLVVTLTIPVALSSKRHCGCRLSLLWGDYLIGIITQMWPALFAALLSGPAPYLVIL